MFTGIIKEVGKIIKIEEGLKSKKITVSCNKIINDIKEGDSIAVNGCCLTVSGFSNNFFTADISYSTINTTTFKNMVAGSFVNLEDSLRPSGKLGGHFVTGHIDDIIRLLGIEVIENSYKLDFELPDTLKAFIACRGSVAIDGMSLTVAESCDKCFSVAIIPHTYANTNLKSKKTGDLFNVEIDLLARYIANLLFHNGTGFKETGILDRENRLKEKLIEYGF